MAEKKEIAEEKSKEERRKRIVRILEVILSLLLLLLIYLLYLYYQFLVGKGPGIAEKGRVEIKPLVYMMSIYGTGGRNTPLFNRPNGVALDSERIYVADTGNNRVCVFDREGRFLFSFGGLGVAKGSTGKPLSWRPGKFHYPYGIDVSDKGNIYVADTLNWRVQVFNKKGKPLFWFPQADEGEQAQIYPLDIDVYRNRVYVVDGYKKRVAVFSLEGKYLFSLGEKGELAGMLRGPLSVAVGKDDVVYITDKLNLDLAAYQPIGKIFWVRGRPAKNSEDRFFGLPAGVAVDGKGYIYVVDAFSFDIKIFNPRGELLAAVGKRGEGASEFNFARGIKAYKNMLAVADMENDRVQIFKVDWEELKKIEEKFK
jgi:DNA-binding beta-propeller fold protein YncE